MSDVPLSNQQTSKQNYLVVVGTGISVSHLTSEAAGWISCADQVLYCVADAATELQIRQLNPNWEDLYRFYATGKPRRETYRDMSDRILAVLNEGKNVCAVYYGHPGMFVKPAHVAIEQARADGYRAWMCPAVSSIDVLVADLGVDLSWDGCQIFEATDFMLRKRVPNIESGLILLQIGCVGDPGFNRRGFDGRHFPLLVDRLATFYGVDYRVVLYEASPFPICAPRIDSISIRSLRSIAINGVTTMYVPAVRRASIDMDMSRYFRSNMPSYNDAESHSAQPSTVAPSTGMS